MQYPSPRRARTGAQVARVSLTLFALFTVAVASCSRNETGRLAADHTGDLGAPPIARITTGDRNAACASVPGQAQVIDAKALARAPYLQRVTAQDAVVVWTSDKGTAASVVVTKPDGTEAQTFPAAVEPGVLGAGGALQWTSPVGGLTPDTMYCYTVVQNGQPVTAPATLKSAPAPGAGGRVQFVALGDSGGGGSDQEALLQQLETVPFDFMIHVGDIAYDHGLLPEFESRFFRVYAPLLAERPIFPASGNHEYDTDDGAPFRQVFALPENGGPAGVERWYSYDWGDVHFVVLDTERSGPDQAAWLEADLTANKLPWTIVYGHKPPHSSGEHGDDPGFNTWFVPILTAHHVQLVLAGHDHDYERFHPIDGVTYIVTGGGGKGVRELGSPKPGSAFADSVIHLLVVSVDGDTLTTHAIDGTGHEFDTTVIPRS
jgi:hypothetical protein